MVEAVFAANLLMAMIGASLALHAGGLARADAPSG